MSGLIDTLRSRLKHLPRQEAAVARAVLSDPNATLHVAIARLARQASVSQPTVLRFCRSFGYSGFPEFKVALAQSLVSGVAYVSAHVEAGDDAAAYAPKVLDAAAAALRTARNRIDTDSVAAAAKLFAGARQVMVCGFGGSAATAIDAVHKLSRFPIPCRQLSDPLLALMAVESAEPQDVLFAISNTGRTRAIIDIVAAARARGIDVVALSAPGSPVAERATVAVLAEPAEDAEIFTPMASRIVQLALIDVLVTGLAIGLGSQVHERLGRIKRTLAGTRTGRDDGA
ncbi:MAG: SIS domain-containing protein [Rhodospirillales bacterium]|nr:SIS domain-containing protein [Rhodospirillales bacterium]